ncbi:hypothetical protein NCU16627 [Neurospora crassa OR74A]|uniref:Uncharacterized protein n=1 Tax=Neurospora crassa (strain ATCC 24698 / 74-OR23-1A / CBS 708.71 / DSM 1257 / FGSC 987) TaxID=367110 RepID=U9WGE4_NEUCR|nr:hypothetical protein NCU16627 [Neurospora crassa OR74A]ESA43158.1 hypothetical protein NCU16627 [Neurospora crassa OR74A]|eukprot:XP_011394022.1 hypothetical protein NCU16627 [Neurospora crassa OR74A]
MFHVALNGAEWDSKLPEIDPFQTFPDLNGLLPSYRHEQSQQQPVNLRYCDKTCSIHPSVLETLLENRQHPSKTPPWSIVDGWMDSRHRTAAVNQDVSCQLGFPDGVTHGPSQRI